MRIQTILNRVEKFKSFVYDKAPLEDHVGGPALVVQVLPRKNSLPYCSGCYRRGRTYDHLKERRFEFIPLWGILVFLIYRMRRVDCPRCGVTVEIVPWSDGKNQLTTTYRWFLASWAKRLSWGEVGTIFRTSWDSVCRAVEHAVEWGLKHRDLSQVTALGIDEVAWQRGHTYMTLLYDISSGAKRLLGVAENRTEASLRSCLDELGQDFCPRIKFVCSDMWQPYLKVIGERLGNAIHVLDRFHIMKQFGQALDEIRAEETKRLKRDGYEPNTVEWAQVTASCYLGFTTTEATRRPRLTCHTDNASCRPTHRAGFLIGSPDSLRLSDPRISDKRWRPPAVSIRDRVC
jgi:transposase